MDDFCELGGCVGAVLIDEVPLLDHARVKPFIIALLLFRGAVRLSEVVGMLSAVCHEDDRLIGTWDRFLQDYADAPMVEKIAGEVLGEMTSSGLLRYNEEKEIWVLTGNQLSEVINWTQACGGRLPMHLVVTLESKVKHNTEKCKTKSH